VALLSVAIVLMSGFYGCYCTCFWMLQYSFLVAMVASGFYSSFLVVTEIISCCCFVAVVVSGCYNTLFWFLQYSFLVVTVVISCGYGTLFCLLWLLLVVVTLLVSGFYSTNIWLSL
jgi:hypothetical protein